MEGPGNNPPPPDLEGLTWRLITRDDLPVLVELASACHLADGGLGFMFEPDNLKDQYFPDAPGTAIGAFASNGHLVASAAVYASGEPDVQRVIIVGHVQPDLRGRGILS